ncbi:MAG: TolC family protein [Bacteroidales bacterium]|nr:TolC family protein [Bacteroidales bacterium]
MLFYFTISPCFVSAQSEHRGTLHSSLEECIAFALNNNYSTEIQRNTLKTLLSTDPRQPISILTPDENTMDRIATLPTEENVLTRSLEALPDLPIYDYNINIAELDVKLSKSSYIPSLSLSTFVGTGLSQYEQFGSYLSNESIEQVGLNLTIPIFSRNQVKSDVQQSQIALQQLQMARAQAEISLEESIIENYNNVDLLYNKATTSTYIPTYIRN